MPFAAAQLANGTVIVFMRHCDGAHDPGGGRGRLGLGAGGISPCLNRTHNRRIAYALSTDASESFGGIWLHQDIASVVCEGSVRRVAELVMPEHCDSRSVQAYRC